MRILQTISYSVLVFLTLGASFKLLTNHLDQPIVAYSYTTGECLYVEHKAEKYSCDVLPEKFIKEWHK